MFGVLLVGIFLLFILSYLLFKHELFTPSIIVGVVYCISMICALFNYQKWGLSHYNSQTAFIILFGIFLFLIVSIVANQIFLKRRISSQKLENMDLNNGRIVHLPFSILFLFFLMIIGISGWKLYDVVRVAHMYGSPENLFDSIGLYRSIVSYSTSNIQYDPPFLLNQFEKVITVISYIFMYFVINNLFCKDKLKNNLIYIFYLVLFILYIVLTGGRMPLLKLAAASLFFCFCFSNRKRQWKVSVSKKYIKIGLISILVLFILFYALHGVLGRNRKFDPTYYITMYAGGSIKLLDMYIEEPARKTSIFGKESLYNVNIFLGKLGLTDSDYIKHLEFRRYKGLYLGNIYTPFRRYYADFGILGLVVMVSLYSFIMNYFYLKTKEKIKKGPENDLWMLSYGLIIYTLFLYSIDDQFFTVVCSVNYTILFILLIFFYRLFIKLNIAENVVGRSDNNES